MEQAVPAVQTGYVPCDSFNIHYAVYGQSQPLDPVSDLVTVRPVVLVHGWGSDTEGNWVATGWVERLLGLSAAPAAGSRVVVSLDVRGHGKSDKPHAAEPYSYAAMSRDVLAVMDALQIEQADYIGYSMGAFMGAYLLGHHAQRFTSMVLGGIGDETPASAAQGEVIACALRAPDEDSVTDAAGGSVRAFVEANSRNDPLALAYSAARMWPEGYPLKIAGPDISHADIPVLIVNGENDHPYVDSADTLAHSLPQGRHVRVPGKDHLSLVPAEGFKQVVVDFLTSH